MTLSVQTKADRVSTLQLRGKSSLPDIEETLVERLTGKVVWFNNGKGFGFVSQDNGPDVFCHFTSIQGDGYKSLREGDSVEFSIVQGDKGPQTEHVIRLME